MTDEEKDFYEKYIKQQYTIAKRIKRKIFGPRKRVKTISDFDGIEGGFLNLIKILFAIVIISFICTVVMKILEIYRWFFPLKETLPQSPFFKYVYMNYWILIANTTPPIFDYVGLTATLVSILLIVVGLIGIIRGLRARYICSECGHDFRSKKPQMTIPASGKFCPICGGIAEETDS